MSAWPENPYLAAYLRSPEGQAYLEKHRCLEAWKRRHLLDPVGIPIVEDPSMPRDSFKLVSTFDTVHRYQRRIAGRLEFLMNLYNEFDPYAADWLENLIAAGHIPGGKVDRRSIKDIRSEDLASFTQVHTFAGIAGWPLALHLAGWPATRPVWTGSAPCQPYSAAGKQKGNSDDRDLWPDFLRLIRERHPETVFGEQVANAVGFGWIDRVQADLASEGYALWYVILGAHSVGAPHIRQRLYWVAYTKDSDRGTGIRGAQAGTGANGIRGRRPSERGAAGRLGESLHARLERLSGNGNGRSQSGRIDSASTGSISPAGGDGERLADTSSERRQQVSGVPSGHESQNEGRGENGDHEPAGDGENFWSSYNLVPCFDGKARKIKPGIFPLAHGVSGGVAVGSAIQESAASLSDEEKAHIVSRVGVLKAAGNAIVPQVAAEFIKAFMEITQ